MKDDIVYSCEEEESYARNSIREIEDGADINELQPGRSWLHLGVSRGYTAWVKQLLDAGADPNVRDDNGQTPLHHAAENCDELSGELAFSVKRAVRALLKAGADSAALNGDGDTPLHIAASRPAFGNDAYESVSYLVLGEMLSRGADFNARSSKKQARPGTDPLIILRSQDAALHRAALHGNAPGAALLCHVGAGVGIKDDQGRTPLHIAAIEKCGMVIHNLLRYGDGVDPLQVDDYGNLPLHYAVMPGSDEAELNADQWLYVVDQLREHGGTQVRNHAGRIPQDMICQTPQRVRQRIIDNLQRPQQEQAAPAALEPEV